MKATDVYFEFKKKYLNFIVLMQMGNFFEVLGSDCYMIHDIFGYKVSPYSKTIRSGFPITSLNKVTDKLDSLKINYLVIKNGEIEIKRKFNMNHYNNHLKMETLSTTDRITMIYHKLLSLEGTSNIDSILSKVEKVL